MKRVVSLLLACVIVLGAFPFTAMAAPSPMSRWPVKQAPVSLFNIETRDTDGKGGNQYMLRFFWERPAFYSQDTEATETIPWVSYAEWYELYYRKATDSISDQPNLRLGADILGGQDDSNEQVLTPDTQLVMDPGSLYEFQVKPFHKNTRLIPDNQGGYVPQQYNAPVDTALGVPPERRAIFMSDLTVTAESDGGSQITVTWSNPTWGRSNIFAGYTIYYQVNNNIVQPITSNATYVPMAEITDNLDGTLSYTLVNNRTIFPGYTYDIKVEPMKSDKVRVRDENNIFINNVEYYIAYRDPAVYEYRTDKDQPVMIKTALYWDLVGDNYIRLFWDTLKDIPNPGSIETLRIWEVDYETGKEIGLLGTISGNFLALNTSEWMLDKPDAKSAYVLALYDRNDSLMEKTNIVYFDPAHNDFSPYKPEIFSFDAYPASLSLDLRWQAFTREPYNENEKALLVDDPTGKPVYVDQDLIYDLYVADSYELLEELTLPSQSIPASRLGTPTVYPDPPLTAKYLSYRLPSPILRYYTRDPLSNTPMEREITDNKVYYVKIVATRGSSGERSQAAYASVFMLMEQPIDVDPSIIAAPPLRVESITDTEMTVVWDTKYLEIYRPDPSDPSTGTWHAVIGVDADDDAETLFTLNDAIDRVAISAVDTKDPAAVYAFLYGLGGAREVIARKLNNRIPLDEIVLRIVDLTGASYELHTVNYDHMMLQGGYEKYLAGNLTGLANWYPTSPAPGTQPGTLRTTLTATNAPAAGPLAPNTAYVVYMRPYVIASDNTHRFSYYPSYVMGTTKDTTTPVDVEPTTPILHGDSVTDMTATVYWLSMDEALFEYDLAYSDKLSDFPNTGTVIPWSQIRETALTRPDEKGEPYLYYTVPGLFPDTEYYFWIRSRVNGRNSKDWSNPIDMKTLDIRQPIPPQGLGLAGQDHVSAYNRQGNTSYLPAEENALIIEWMRDSNDTAAPAATGTATGGNVAALNLSNLLTMYMARFDGLTANAPYYLRAKTVLTVSRASATGTNLIEYNYVVQLSQDGEFKDYIEYTIPVMQPTASLDPFYAKRKESEWCDTIRLYTQRSLGEYDGDVNPDQYPLPEEDWEIIFDPYTGTLTQRFRTDKTDASGASDQLVDQRFISRLVAERTFTYRIDLTSYGTRAVQVRVVELPHSIVQAFNERKITLEMTAGNMVVSVPPGAYDTAALRSLSDLGAGTVYKLTVASGTTSLPTLAAGDSYVSDPQKVSVQVITPTRAVTLSTFAKPIGIKMALNSRVTGMEQNLGLYTSTANTGGWSLQPSAYSATEAALTAQVYRPGAFAGVAKSIPAAAASDPTRDAMVRVTAHLNITDLTQYRSGVTVNTNRFNNLVAAVALDRPSVTMGSALSAADTQALTRAQLLVTGAVTREAALQSLVTLYELKTRQVIQPAYTADDAPYTDLADASPAHRNAMLKALDIGFTDSHLRPKALLTMGELMQMLDIILQDA